MARFENPWDAEKSIWYGREKERWTQESFSTDQATLTIRRVKITITNDEVGEALVRAYPNPSSTNYIVPLYDCLIEGKTKNGLKISEHFEVIRFGVQYDKSKGIGPKVVGLKDEQTHTLTWVDYMRGSWQVYGDWLIHEGAADPSQQAWGAIGCIEVTGAGEWSRFNDVIRSLSGEKDLREISKSQKLTVTYEPVAQRPPLIESP